MRSILLDPVSVLQGIVSARNKLSREPTKQLYLRTTMHWNRIVVWNGMERYVVNQCKSFNANLRVKIMQRHLFWGNTVYDLINLSLCIWSSQSDLEPPGWWSHSLMESISLWRDRSSTRCSSTFCGIFFCTFVSYMVVHSLYTFVCCMVGMFIFFLPYTVKQDKPDNQSCYCYACLVV